MTAETQSPTSATPSVDPTHDWPGPGPIDLAVHDLPHASAATEWWYQNAHVTTQDGRDVSIFASFFRIATGRDKETGAVIYAHSLAWAISDVRGARYMSESWVDRDAPALGKEKLKRGEGTKDERLRRAMLEVLNKGNVPFPDQMFVQDPYVDLRKLHLEFGDCSFSKEPDGSYLLHIESDKHRAGCTLRFNPRKLPIRHGRDGVVSSPDGGDMFYYFIPRCDVTGTIMLDGASYPVTEGEGWYDHEFGGHQEHTPDDLKVDMAWNWCAVQFDDGSELTAYTLVEVDSGNVTDQRAVYVTAQGQRVEYDEIELEAFGCWRSTRTFNEYPEGFNLRIPAANAVLTVRPSFVDQEFVTLISKPAFWEGRVQVEGTLAGTEITGKGYLERSGFAVLDSLDGFFTAVGKEVRKSVRALIPMEPTHEQVRDLVASDKRESYMDGVDLGKFVDTMIKPVREITDRGGKSWRSYAALACCDVVGGDSREFVQWLAMPELMHVGSLIVDDVQDKSVIRRGGTTSHMIYGEALAINAGTACYFMGQKLLVGPKLSAHDKLRIYDLYFEALRAGHAGQALDLGGVDDLMDAVVETGVATEVKRRVIAIHRLKTAAPAASLARMGAVAGRGTEEQIEALGKFFESVGLAFQYIDDVLNLRGFKSNLKDRGEDIKQGKITLPVALGFERMGREERQWLRDTVASQPQDMEIVLDVIARLERVGAISDVENDARRIVEDAWHALDAVTEDSLPKLMLRAFGWYVLERHY